MSGETVRRRVVVRGRVQGVFFRDTVRRQAAQRGVSGWVTNRSDGAVEAVFCILAIRDQIVPPTLNLDDPDEGTDGVDLVPHTAKKREVKAALSNSFGFGGTNASVIFKAVEA